eukprot:TRINITY_DN31149_c0_g1_i1.p1 TRINITY_DN31149_c0_g1~~TRINITY_DN31149_c0_g1_i1.p1  ORF type:complete len:507 (+),score=76.80 TRINITY_DN31149_c0_g1_i1:65-1522(+)
MDQVEEVDVTDMSWWLTDEALSRVKCVFDVFRKVCGDEHLEINKQQLFNLFELIRPGAVSLQESDDMFDEIDRNRNGKIDGEEFVSHVFGVSDMVAKVMEGEGIAQIELHALIFGSRTEVLDHLHEWTRNSVTLRRKGKNIKFRLKSVAAEDCKNLETWVPALVDSVSMKFTSRMLFVTGASWTDRRNAIIGGPLNGHHSSAERGILPLALERFNKYKEAMLGYETIHGHHDANKFFLGVSLLEFCDGLCYDLLQDGLPVTFDVDSNMPQAFFADAAKASDLLPLLDHIEKQRAHHGREKAGSCHYAWHLCFYETFKDFNGYIATPGDNVCRKNSFLLLDVATTRKTDHELGTVVDEIPKASDSHSKVGRYRPLTSKNLFVRCVHTCLTGFCKPIAAACLSLSKEDDAHNWPAFSFAESVAKLKVKPYKPNMKSYEETLAAAKSLHEQAASKLAKASEKHALAYQCLTGALGREVKIWEQLRLPE